MKSTNNGRGIRLWIFSIGFLALLFAGFISLVIMGDRQAESRITAQKVNIVRQPMVANDVVVSVEEVERTEDIGPLFKRKKLERWPFPFV